MAQSPIRHAKSWIYQQVTGQLAAFLYRKDPRLLYGLGWDFMRRSGVELGAFPVPFQLSELIAFDPDECEPKDYVAAMQDSDMAWSDNFPKRCRFYVLAQMLEYALDRMPPTTAVAECGCWWGHSTAMMARQIARRAAPVRLFAFDSFEGLSSYQEQDMGGLAPDEHVIQTQRQKFFAADLETVKRNLAKFDFVELFKGWIPDRFDEVKDVTFGLVHIDVDMYQPTLDSLNFFYPRLMDGGCIVLDDYGSRGFLGAKRAVDAFLAQHRPAFFLKLPAGGALLIK